ncbi:heme ABC transporter ATP-binding protein [Hydrogenophaga palleronii]|uniref:heme ABC transporter ATP-binding protein n=1 Tax=Hydrogenophaga palleronii TaxID=65655 RepID=UPI000A063EEB|nr:heme ABC transporter ATP-binding protein [Hydrogenophaga palleronii]
MSTNPTHTAASANATLLVLENAGYAIEGKALVEGVSLAFAPGTLTALVGPNGAGKSTLLGLIAGDLKPTQGQARLHGRPIGGWRVRELALQRSVLPQDHSVRFAFSVREVVAMGRLPHPPDPERDEAIVDNALDTADIRRLADREVPSLSGGEAARTAFARVLTQQTPLVLLDEPTAALDLQHQESLLRSARGLAREGACVIAVLHDLNLASAYADRVVVLSQGRVAADGTPREVFTRERIQSVYRQPVAVIEHPTRGIPLVVTIDP